MGSHSLEDSCSLMVALTMTQTHQMEARDRDEEDSPPPLVSLLQSPTLTNLRSSCLPGNCLVATRTCTSWTPSLLATLDDISTTAATPMCSCRTCLWTHMISGSPGLLSSRLNTSEQEESCAGTTTTTLDQWRARRLLVAVDQNIVAVDCCSY